jgi:putative transposase
MVAGVCYHVISRGNNRARVFSGSADYRAFFELVETAQNRIPLSFLAACLMPNHFHFVLMPRESGDLGRWMQWLLTAHVHRHHQREGTSGRLWQGRFKAFPIQRDEHLLTVMRYVERNALRAGLVEDARSWPWGSLAWRSGGRLARLLAPSPVSLPANWAEWVNAPQTPVELDQLRACVNRQRPYGSDDWVNRTAAEFGLESSLHPVGRPFKRIAK